MRAVVGLLGRLVFWIGLIFIVGHAAVASLQARDYVMLLLKLGFFPLTYMIYPWYTGLWWVLLVSWTGYIVSTKIGKMPPED